MKATVILVLGNGGHQELSTEFESIKDLCEDMGFDVEGVESGGSCAKVVVAPPPSAFAASLFDFAANMARVQTGQFTAPLKGNQP